MKNLNAFIWAAMHSPEFHLCSITLPLSFRCYKTLAPGFIWAIGVEFHRFSIYLPWRVLCAFERASNPSRPQYDDIPF